jgi:phosphoglycerate dehydrogenase-like enzyme
MTKAAPLDTYHLVTVLVHSSDAQMFTFPAHLPSGEAVFVHGTGLNLMDCADDKTRGEVIRDMERSLALYVAELIGGQHG